MKVSQLKELLNSFDDDLDVLTSNGEGGYYDVNQLGKVIYVKDVNDYSGSGPHEIIESEYEKKKYELNEKFKGLLLD